MLPSYQEKSLWLSLLALLIAFGGYFLSASTMLLNTPFGDVSTQQAGAFGAATALLVTIIVAGEIVLAIIDRNAETDERDRWIAARGERWGGCVLGITVFAALATATQTTGNALMAHVLLGGWVLSEIVSVGTRLFLYRRTA